MSWRLSTSGKLSTSRTELEWKIEHDFVCRISNQLHSRLRYYHLYTIRFFLTRVNFPSWFWLLRYSTVCHWDFNNPTPITDKGKPFTRLIWKTTQQMGMGRSTFQVDNFNCTVVVARYSPYVNALDFSENVPRGHFSPTVCQYKNNKEDQDFITPQQPGKACQRIPGFTGQMLVESSACTFKQLFSIFGASVRKGKQGFSVLL